MHWGGRFLGGAGSHGVNTLTTRASDPESRQPELKHAAVSVTKADLPWRLVAFGLPASGSASRLADRLAALGAAFDCAVSVLIGRECEGALLRAAAATAPAPTTIAAIDDALGLDHAGALRYDDARRGIGRRLDVRDGRLVAVRVCGDPDAVVAAAWLQEWLVGGQPVAPIRRRLLAPTATSPAGCALPDRVVCTCENVPARAIADALPSLPVSPVESLAALQAQLKCGTGCGSCVPELKRMIAGRERPMETAA
jgi:assimilatory nitrate reductase catalytic subunit